jgi:hypothetical protein
LEQMIERMLAGQEEMRQKQMPTENNCWREWAPTWKPCRKRQALIEKPIE